MPIEPTGAPPGYDFDLDPFQQRAIAALDAGRSVLVAAPTGSGKTVVAEHAVAKALAEGGKTFYTTPIKALSNQKYGDLVRRHGPERVGLLTGDNAVNGDAPVVVMTTEVLRNMIYARSAALEGLRFVVLDEVHFLQDVYRGPVWEEVMIHLDPSVRLVCLSATVSNATEVAEWIGALRGPTDTVLEERRPVDLINLYGVEDREAAALTVLPLLVDGRPNPEGMRFDATPAAPGRGRPRRRYATPRRLDVVDVLHDRDLLPAIYFIFSRAACDDAMRACVTAGLRLTGPADRSRIREIVERHVAGLDDHDLDVLGYQTWLAGLEAGFAAHHAGMVPPFKEAVEECFAAGLVRVVFATETLALGINMPARTVVIEKLTKFTGEHHEFLTPGQYTQLTGRAGRRGIDDLGHALVLWSPFVPFADVAALASSRSFELTSAFRPTYNMAANLVRRCSPEEAHRLLNLSFAQFRADRAVVRLESRRARREAELAELRDAATCERGDVDAYRALVDAERAEHRARRAGLDDAVQAALARLAPGDVVWLRGGKNAGKAAVLSVSHRKGGAVRIRAVTAGRRVVNLGSADFRDPPEPLGRIDLPSPFTPSSTAFQRKVAESLHAARVQPPKGRADRTPEDDDDEPRAAAGREDAWRHPVADCPDRDEHLRAARQADRVAREVRDLRHRIAGHTETLSRQFDRVLQLLEAWGYLEGWALTGRGERLVRVFHESDLLLVEALEEGLLDGLDAPTLAGLVSCFTYEHRSPVPPPPPWFPSAAIRHRVERLQTLADELAVDEHRAGSGTTRPPDPTFFALAHAWAAGDDLGRVLEEEDLSGGDFVRNIRQVVDLLGQVADAASDPATSRTARQAVGRILRGVVAASSAVGSAPPEDG